MKKIVFICLIAFFGTAFSTTLFAQKINVIFQNNGGSGTRSFKLTIIAPDGTKTTQDISLPYTRRQTVALEIGSKVFLDNTKLLNTIVGGKAIATDAPFMTVAAKDKNQVMNLVEETNATQAVIDANVAISAAKLKIPVGSVSESSVSGNTVTTVLKDAAGNILAEFDTDKKTGNVKLITDLRKK